MISATNGIIRVSCLSKRRRENISGQWAKCTCEPERRKCKLLADDGRNLEHHLGLGRKHRHCSWTQRRSCERAKNKSFTTIEISRRETKN